MYFLLMTKRRSQPNSRLRFLEGSRKCNCFFCCQPCSVRRFRQFSAFYVSCCHARCVVGYFTKAKRCTHKGHDPTTRSWRVPQDFCAIVLTVPNQKRILPIRKLSQQSRVSCLLLCLCVCVFVCVFGWVGGGGWGWSSQNFRARTFDDALQGFFRVSTTISTILHRFRYILELAGQFEEMRE